MKGNKPPSANASREDNPALKLAILEMVDTQLRHNDPPLIKQTYDRLMTEGFSVPLVREMIAAAMTNEMYQILKKQAPFDHSRYAAALKRLPKMPRADERGTNP